MVAKDLEYYGALISDTNMGWTEFHCNNCGNLIGFLNSIDENIYDTYRRRTHIMYELYCNKEMNINLASSLTPISRNILDIEALSTSVPNKSNAKAFYH